MRAFLDQNLRNTSLSALAGKLSGLSGTSSLAMECVLANLVKDRFLIFPLKEDLYPINRYKKFTSIDIFGTVDFLLARKLVTRISSNRIYSSDKLASQLSICETSNVVDEPIILRRKKFSKLDYDTAVEYKDNERTIQMRQDVLRYNEYMAHRKVMALDVRYSTAFHRVFNNFSWHDGGRFYCEYQGLRGHPSLEIQRSELTIDSKGLIELDFVGYHPTLLLLREGLPVPPDPYCIPGVDRDVAKLVFNIVLNSSRENTSIWTVKKNLGILYADAKEIVVKVKQHFEMLGRYLFSGEGIRIQNLDSRIASGILMGCLDKDIPILSVHDSFLVTKEHVDFLRAQMVQHFQTVLGTSHVPNIKMK